LVFTDLKNNVHVWGMIWVNDHIDNNVHDYWVSSKPLKLSWKMEDRPH
jgi:hypothetical protein